MMNKSNRPPTHRATFSEFVEACHYLIEVMQRLDSGKLQESDPNWMDIRYQVSLEINYVLSALFDLNLAEAEEIRMFIFDVAANKDNFKNTDISIKEGLDPTQVSALGETIKSDELKSAREFLEKIFKNSQDFEQK